MIIRSSELGKSPPQSRGPYSSIAAEVITSEVLIHWSGHAVAPLHAAGVVSRFLTNNQKRPNTRADRTRKGEPQRLSLRGAPKAAGPTIMPIFRQPIIKRTYDRAAVRKAGLPN